MSYATQGSKRKSDVSKAPPRKRKALPVLGAAGLSLSLASGASAAIGGPAADMQTRNGGVSHEITLCEEEISDVSLATFYVSDKEHAAGTFRPRVRYAMGACGGCACGGCGGCGGCWTGTYYTSPVFGGDAYPPYHPAKPSRKYVPKNR